MTTLTQEMMDDLVAQYSPQKRKEILITRNAPSLFDFVEVDNIIFVHPSTWARFLYKELNEEERNMINRFGSLWGMRIREEIQKKEEDNE